MLLAMGTNLTDDYEYLNCITWLPLHFQIYLLIHHLNEKFIFNACFKIFIVFTLITFRSETEPHSAAARAHREPACAQAARGRASCARGAARGLVALAAAHCLWLVRCLCSDMQTTVGTKLSPEHSAVRADYSYY